MDDLELEYSTKAAEAAVQRAQAQRRAEAVKQAQQRKPIADGDMLADQAATLAAALGGKVRKSRKSRKGK